MFKKLLTLMLFLGLSYTAFNQSPELNWAQGIGEGASYILITDVTIDSEKNYLVAGKFNGTADMDPGTGVSNLTSANMDIFVGKYSSDGSLLWAYSISGAGSNDDPRDIKTDAQNNVYLSGIITGITDIDPSSNTLSVDPGSIQSSFITALDPNGNFQWGYATENMGAVDNNDLTSFDVTAAGEIYFSGIYNGVVDFDFGSGTNQLPSGFAAFFGKLNADGTLAWVHQFTQVNYLNSLVLDDEDQSIYLTANFPGTTVDVQPNAGVQNVSFLEIYNTAVINIDLSGNYISHISIGCDNALEIKKVEYTNNELFVYGIFTGTLDLDPTAGVNTLISANGTGTNQDVFIARYDSVSNLMWARHLTGDNYVDDGSMTTDVYGNSYFSGYGYGNTDTDPGSLTDTKPAGLYIVKLDQDGNRVWVYYDMTQYAVNIALTYNKYEHSLIGTGDCSNSTDLDPQPTVFNIPAYAGYLLNWSNCNTITYETTVSYNAGVLSAVDTLPDDSFQWFDCITSLPISGEDSSVFDPTQAGTYQVQIANQYGACPSLSNCILFSDASIDSDLPIDLVDPLAFNIYPNPATNQITLSHLVYQYDLVIKNTSGETVYAISDQSGDLTIQLENLTAGIYIVQVITTNGIGYNTFIKN